MLLIYIALLILMLWKCQCSGKGFFAEESLSFEVTTSVKGIFIWLVFLSHFSSYVSYTSSIDQMGGDISVFLGQLIVACFLFYSGFGVFESYKKKGMNYAQQMPKKRILRTLLHFDLAVILFLLLNLSLDHSLSLPQILLSFIAWDAVGNSNWYIFVILILYLISWLSFILARNQTLRAALMISVLGCILILCLHQTRPSFWYDTILCFVLGVWVSMLKEQFLTFLTKSNWHWLISLLTSLSLFLLTKYSYLRISGKLCAILGLLTAPLFCLVITITLAKFKISNTVLGFSGRYLFEIYILQRIPMILFDACELSKLNTYLYFVACLITTIALSVGFRTVTNRIHLFHESKENK